MPIPKEYLDKFLSLACDLSPENLSCDGELSRTQVASRLRRIRIEWANLERKIGQKVTEDDVWNAHRARGRG